MRLLGKRFLRQKIHQHIETRIETKDAVLFEVHPSERYAEVKIQGTNKTIIAYYPLNWETTPVWLKKGNAVKINFTGGIRGRIELIGHGGHLPTPVSGEGGGFVIPDAGDDGIVDHPLISPTSPVSMDVNVSAGTVRISEDEISFDADTITIDAAPTSAYYYRYDIIVVGSDGVIDYVKGSESNAVEPTMPSTPAGHVRLGWIFLAHTTTAIESKNINTIWSDPEPVRGLFTFSDDPQEWTDLNNTVTFQVLDQWDETISASRAGYTHYDITFEWAGGNGTLDGVTSPTSVVKESTSGTVTMTYTRDQLLTDLSPTFKATVTAEPAMPHSIVAWGSFTLLDEFGKIMTDYGHVGDVVVTPGTSITPGNIPVFDATDGSLGDSGVAADEIIVNPDKSAVDNAIPIFVGTDGITVESSLATVTDEGSINIPEGQTYNIGGVPHTHEDTEEDADLSFFPEYAGAAFTPSGSNNDPGTLGMFSDFETVSNVVYNYYEWMSSVATGLQSYDINVKIPIPHNFDSFQTGTNTALTLDIKTEENTTTNNKLDVTIQKDGSGTTSSLTDQVSATAATWESIGFDDSNTVLASLAAGDVLNVKVRMYSQNSKYVRIGKINLQVTLT